MFAAAFILAFIIVHVTAEIPSYIHVCGRRDPKIEQCILNSISNMKSKFCKGIPELDVPSIDPLIIDKLVLFDTNIIKIYATNIQIENICNSNITYLHIDDLNFDIDLTFDQIRINTTYNMDLRFTIPMQFKGRLNLILDNIEAKVNMICKIVTKNSKRFIYLAEMKIHLDIKNLNSQLGETDNKTLMNDIIHNFLGENNKEILKTIIPIIENIISEYIIDRSNSIVKHFTYEELFPDRT